jgi:hypothetical protein
VSAQIVSWGNSDKVFVVVTGDMIHQRKLYFKTQQVDSFTLSTAGWLIPTSSFLLSSTYQHLIMWRIFKSFSSTCCF